jgi:hypothetical protein
MLPRPESSIEMASRHVMEGDIRCCRQADLIERMRDLGHDTRRAQNLLNVLEQCLALSYIHVRRLTEQLYGP